MTSPRSIRTQIWRCTTHAEHRSAVFRPQEGRRLHNVGKGSDDTLFALKSGKVKFERLGRDRKQVSIVEIAQ